MVRENKGERVRKKQRAKISHITLISAINASYKYDLYANIT